MKTRIEMETETVATLAELLDTSLVDSGQRVRAHVWKAVEEVAKRTRCCYTKRFRDIVANVSEYPDSGITEVDTGSIKDSAGNYVPLSVRSARELDTTAWLWNWRTLPADPLPQILVTAVGSNIVLVPACTENRAQGLLLEGRWEPGENWLYDWDRPLDPDDNDPCPLPDFAISAALAGAKHRFAKALRVRFPALRGEIPDMEAEFLTLLATVERTVSKQWQNLR
jgi:hypothetical protein